MHKLYTLMATLSLITLYPLQAWGCQTDSNCCCGCSCIDSNCLCVGKNTSTARRKKLSNPQRKPTATIDSYN